MREMNIPRWVFSFLSVTVFLIASVSTTTGECRSRKQAVTSTKQLKKRPKNIDLRKLYRHCLVTCSKKEFIGFYKAVVEVMKHNDRLIGKVPFKGTPRSYKYNKRRKKIRRPYSLMFIDELLRNSQARADGELCFFGGWPSVRIGGRCQRPWRAARSGLIDSSEYQLYDRNHYCGPSNQFRCNPVLFGGGDDGKGFCITISNFNGLTEACAAESERRGGHDQVVQRLRDEPAYRENYQRVVTEAGSFCDRHPTYDACVTLRARGQVISSLNVTGESLAIEPPAPEPDEDTALVVADGETDTPIVADGVIGDEAGQIGIVGETERLGVAANPEADPANEGPAAANLELSDSPWAPAEVPRPRARPENLGQTEEVGPGDGTGVDRAPAGEHHTGENETLDDNTETALANFRALGGDETAFYQLNCFRQRHQNTLFEVSSSASGYDGGVRINNECKHAINQQTTNSNRRRLFIIDFCTGVVEVMATGNGSSNTTRITQVFSNVPNSNRMPSGFHVTGQLHSTGKSWSQGIKLHGVERGINDNSFDRGVVVHRGWYVNSDGRVTDPAQNGQLSGYQGRSHGCPTVESSNYNYLKDIFGVVGFENADWREPVAPRPRQGGGIFYNYSPRERDLGASYCGTEVMTVEE